MGKYREMAQDYAIDLEIKLQTKAQSRFIQWVMKEEDVDYETAWAICTGKTVPKEPEYTLGYKLCDPMLQQGMAMHPRKKVRGRSKELLLQQLDEDELKLYNEYYKDKNPKKMWKEEKKRQKVADQEEEDALDLEGTLPAGGDDE